MIVTTTTNAPVSAEMMAPSATNHPGRRLKPRIIDTDWLLLRHMPKAITTLAMRAAKPGDVVLDFGCGSSPYAGIFTELGCVYRGADFGLGGDLVIGADGRLQADGGWADGVGSFQVLEHVRDVGRYFSEAARAVGDQGWMILSTHGSWLYHPHPEDHRRWTRQGLISEIEANGFLVEDCISLTGPLAWTTMLRLTGACYMLKKVPGVGALLCAGLASLMNLKGWVEDRITPAWITRDNACVYVCLCRRVIAP